MPAQVITTFAGGDFVFTGDGKPAVNAPLGKIYGLTTDPAGNPVLSDFDNCMTARIGANGILTVIAGTRQCEYIGFSGDGGPATNASIQRPFAAAFDSAGNFYTTTGSRIRKINATGIISQFAGSERLDFAGDGGPALNAAFRSEGGLACDSLGNLYIPDSQNNRIRKITRDGIVSTFAGNGAILSSGDGGLATQAGVAFPKSVAFDAAGNLYIAEAGSGRIRKITPANIISTVSEFIPRLESVTVDRSGVIYAASSAGVYRVAQSSSQAVLIAGNSDDLRGFAGDGGPAANALFNGPLFVAAGNGGVVYVGDQNNYRVRKISADGIITTIAGNGNFKYTGENVSRFSAPLNFPGGVAIDSKGNIYVVETASHRVRKISGDLVTTFAGTGERGFSGDGGPATQARLFQPSQVIVDKFDNVYVADSNNLRIRKITPQGIISTFKRIDNADPACSCPWITTPPVGLAVDSAGNVFVSTFQNISKIDTSGRISLFMGGTTAGFAGDNGPAAAALVNGPAGMAFDQAGNLYIADSGNNRVRRVTPQGVVSTVAGTGSFAGDPSPGPATQTGIGQPLAVAFDSAGNLYIAGGDNLIRRVTPQGAMTTFGGGSIQFDQLGDGKAATRASLSGPAALVFDIAGNLYIADSSHHRIRQILASQPAMEVTPTLLSLFAPSGGAPLTQTVTVRGTLPGLEFAAAAAVTASQPWLSVQMTAASTPRLLGITANPARLLPGRYSGTVTITPAASTPAQIVVNVDFEVGAVLAPKLVLEKPNVSLTFPAGATKRSTTVSLTNAGGGVANFTVSASTNAGGGWLSVTPPNGSLAAAQSVVLTIAADPSGLAVGTYSGQIDVVSASGGNLRVPVTITISNLSQALLLTQTGLSFQAVERGGVIPSQSFGVVNLGSGVMNWITASSTLSGGPNWLSVTPSSGSSDAEGVAPQVTVGVNPAGLAPGTYYGLVRINSATAANTPQVVTVFLEVLRAGSDPGALVQPPEILFPFFPGAVPGTQSVLVYNVGAEPKSFRTDRDDAQASFVAVPREGVLDPNQPTRILIQPLVVPLGRTSSVLNFQFSDGRVTNLKFTFVPAAAAAPGSTTGPAARPADCVPTTLIPALTTLGQAFAVSAGWPVALSVDVRDDCGNPQKSGSVSAAFSNGDVPLALQSLGDGTWQGTWASGSTPQNGVTIRIEAREPVRQIFGTREISGALGSQKDPPLIAPNSVGSAAGFVAYSALAPGGIISIYGDRLSDTTEQNKSLPLPTQLSNTQVFIAGQSVPLFYVSRNQINAQVPSGITLNTTHQVLVQRGLTYSQPIPVDVAPAQPAAFLFGNNTAIAVAFRGDDSFLVVPDRPAKAGDTLVIYCTGLGLTDQQIVDGAAGPSSPPAQTKVPVTMTLGGQPARVVYSGLVAGFVGLYQVNAIVPAGVLPNNAAPLVLTVAGQAGPTSTLPVE